MDVSVLRGVDDVPRALFIKHVCAEDCLCRRSTCVWRITNFPKNQQFATHRCLTVSDSAATARTPPGRASRARVTSRCAIRINSNLIGSRALALSDYSAGLLSSSAFC